MTNPNRSHITMILDRSGSMQIIRSDVVGAINAFIKDQQSVPGECTFSLVQFDDQQPYEVLQDFVNLAEARQLTMESYVPRGNTPLLDAIGRGIADLGAKLSAMAEQDRPSKVIFVIKTDGLENSSCEYSKSQIAKMIKTQTEEFNWQFTFLGANQDAIASGGAMNIPRASSMNFAQTSAGYRAANVAAGNAVSRLRTGQDKSICYSEEDRETAMSS